MKKIRVLHLIKTLNLGGAESNLFNLINEIDQNKFEIHVGYSFGGENEDKFLNTKVKLFKYASNAYKIKSFGSFLIIFNLINYILKNKIQIVHTHSFNTQVWGSISAKLTGIKILEHVHDYRYLEADDFENRKGESRQYKYSKFMRNVSDMVVVLTKQNKGYLISHDIYREERVKEIQNGILIKEHDHNTYSNKNLRNSLKIREGSFVVLTSARTDPTKNIELILRIAPQVLKEAPNTIFLICGTGPLLKELIEKTKEQKIDSFVRLIGFYSGSITDLLRIADLFLLPSFLELHSIALLEALSHKVPVIISRNVGCHGDFIENWENGVLCDPFVDDEWKESILKLVNDKNLRNNIAQEGYRTCSEKFDIKNTVKEIENVYEEMML